MNSKSPPKYKPKPQTNPNPRPLVTYNPQKNVNRQIKNPKEEQNVVTFIISWKEHGIIESKYYINSVLHVDESSHLKYLVTNFSLCRSFILTTLQPSQLMILKDLAPTHNLWRSLGQHPNIVQLVYIDQYKNLPFIMTEFLDCTSLKELVETKTFYAKEDSHTLALKILKLCFSVSRALDFAHDHNLLHSNLKPSNILQTRPAPTPMSTQSPVSDNNNNDNFEIGDQFCITDFGSPYLTPTSLNSTEAFNHKGFNETAKFWPPFLLQFLQSLGGLQAHDPEFESKKAVLEMMKKKADIFGFGTILLYVLVGKVVWRDTGELNQAFIVQILEASTGRLIDQKLIALMLTFILKCIDLQAGFQDFKEVLFDLKAIYNQYTSSTVDLLIEPYDKEIDQSKLEIVEKLHSSLISDLLKPNHKSYQRVKTIRQETKRIGEGIHTPALKKIWGRLTSRIEFSFIITNWLSGKQYDYQMMKRFADYPLFKAFVYDSQRNIPKALDYYKKALPSAANDRLKAIMTKQQILAMVTKIRKSKKFHGHQ